MPFLARAMTAVLQVADQQLGAEEICNLLTSPQVLPHLLRELITEQITAHVEYTTEEVETAFRTLSQAPQYRNLPQSQLERLIPRQLKLQKFKAATWGAIVESEFAQHQERHDQVLFSLIQTNNLEIIQELYFRLREGEASFAELATQYSEGPESRTNGLVGPLELYNLHPKLAHMLRISQPGQVSPPFRVDQWVVIVRLERYLPAEFDEKLRQRLIDEQFEAWMEQAIAQHLHTVKVPPLLDLPTIEIPEKQRASLPPAPPPSRNPQPVAVKERPAAPEPQVAEHAETSPFADTSRLDQPNPNDDDPSLTVDPEPPPIQPTSKSVPFTNPKRFEPTATASPHLWGAVLLAVIPILIGGWTVSTFLNGSEPNPAPAESTDSQPIATAANLSATGSSDVPVADEPLEAANLLPEDVPNPFHAAVNHANTAVEALATAETPAEWEQIAADWEQAVMLMSAVPADHPDYATAQAKVVEYREYLDYAQQQTINPDYRFRIAVRQAEAAAETAQLAQQTQDWQRAMDGWDRAIAAMRAVPVESEHYGLAQEKVLEYQGYRAYFQALLEPTAPTQPPVAEQVDLSLAATTSTGERPAAQAVSGRTDAGVGRTSE